MAWESPRIDAAGAFLAGFDRGERLAKETLQVMQDREYKKQADEVNQQVADFEAKASQPQSEAEAQAMEWMASYQNRMSLGEEIAADEHARAKGLDQFLFKMEGERQKRRMDFYANLERQYSNNRFVPKTGVQDVLNRVQLMTNFAKQQLDQEKFEQDERRLKQEREIGPMAQQEAARAAVKQGTVQREVVDPETGETALVERNPNTGAVNVVPEGKGTGGKGGEPPFNPAMSLHKLDRGLALVPKLGPGSRLGNVAGQLPFAPEGAKDTRSAVKEFKRHVAQDVLDILKVLRPVTEDERNWAENLALSPFDHPSVNMQVYKNDVIPKLRIEAEQSEMLSNQQKAQFLAALDEKEASIDEWLAENVGSAEPTERAASVSTRMQAPDDMPEGTVLKVHPKLGAIWKAPDGTVRKAQ